MITTYEVGHDILVVGPCDDHTHCHCLAGDSIQIQDEEGAVTIPLGQVKSLIAGIVKCANLSLEDIQQIEIIE